MKLTCTASDRAKWEIYEDGEEKWRWRCKAVNGRIVLASHKGYDDKEECISNARRPGLDADAEPEERDDGTRTCRGSNGDEWIFYKKRVFYKEKVRDEWRWRRCIRTLLLEAPLVVGHSSEGYHYRSNFSDCLDNARRPGMDCEPEDDCDRFIREEMEAP